MKAGLLSGHYPHALGIMILNPCKKVIIIKRFLHEIISVGIAYQIGIEVLAGHHDNPDISGVGVIFKLAAKGKTILVRYTDIHKDKHGFMDPDFQHGFFYRGGEDGFISLSLQYDLHNLEQVPIVI
jgi:hypothetical protein